MRTHLALLVCCIVASAIHAAEPPLEFRLVVDQSVNGAGEEKFGTESLWVEPTSSFGASDVKKASHINSFGEWAVLIKLTDDATKRFADYTKKHLNSRLAIRAQGKIVLAPVIQGAIEDGTVQITADFSEMDALKLAEAINGHNKPSKTK